VAASLLRHSPGGSNLISLGTALVAAVLHGGSPGGSKFAKEQPW